MSKVFVIPDVHLKPWMFEKASELVQTGNYDRVVLLGDLVDDWYQEKNIELYHETFDAAIAFIKKYPETFWCYGNHDVSYLWEAMESGYSPFARDTVVSRTEELEKILESDNCCFVHKFEQVLFSHAGLTELFVMRHFENRNPDLDTMISNINQMGKAELWEDDSPIWARPQYGAMRMYPPDVFQVVGHTPVRKTFQERNLLTVDNFSTYRHGEPIGDERFVWIDTIEKTWEFADL